MDRFPGQAFLVLGMHRSGTSCLAGLIAATGAAAAGPAVRNWDNARGHFEALALVRLDEGVLAGSGGHWLAAPAEVRWNEAQAAERERLLGEPVAGRAPLLKDPRALLCLAFWRAARTPFRALGIVRHPLAVARSLAGWRGIPLAEGLALWIACNRALLADHEAHGTPLIDFDRPRDALLETVAAALRRLGVEADPRALADAYEERLVHHDACAAPALERLREAEDLHASLLDRAGLRAPAPPRARYPNAEMARFELALADGDAARAVERARAARAASADPAAVAVQVVAAFLRVRAHAPALEFLDGDAALEAGLHELLRGKVLLAAGDGPGAVRCLAAACAQADPFFQARRLLPHALRLAGRRVEARSHLAALVPDALYPQGPLSLLAEWAWSDGDVPAALEHMAAAVAAAPPHRRGRLRSRRAEWLVAAGDRAGARSELERALSEDPAYPRARAALERLA